MGTIFDIEIDNLEVIDSVKILMTVWCTEMTGAIECDNNKIKIAAANANIMDVILLAQAMNNGDFGDFDFIFRGFTSDDSGTIVDFEITKEDNALLMRASDAYIRFPAGYFDNYKAMEKMMDSLDVEDYPDKDDWDSGDETYLVRGKKLGLGHAPELGEYIYISNWEPEESID